MDNKILTVSQLNNYIKNILENDPHLIKVLIRGEISNFKHHYSGHMYMTLKDENSTIKAVMFKGANRKLVFKPENGMKVIIEGRVGLYEKGGQYQIYLNNIQPDGVGALHLAFEQLKNKLEKEGLFDRSNKKAIPYIPSKIGIVTSSTGAAIKDILNVLNRRFPFSKIYIYPALVQGQGAANEISEGIKYFSNYKVDLIITGRGGGSIEDLWPFNEEIVARAIYNSDIPVISAVGHETDFTIADFVSDMRAPTPSAAAEMAVPSQIELKNKIIMLRRQMYMLMLKIIERKKSEHKRLISSTVLKYPIDRINQNRILIDNLNKHIIKNILAILNIEKEKFTSICGKLNTLSPLNVITRGYSIAQDDKGNIISSIDQIDSDDKVAVRVIDGQILCKVEGKTSDKINEF